MLKKAALVFGVVFVLVGILGFIPGIAPADNDGMRKLLGLFMVDGIHNLVHILSGVAALAASTRTKWSRLYFQVFGVVYALVTILGFIIGDGKVLGFLPVNMWDNVLHLVIAAAALYLGFGFPRERDEDAVTAPRV